MLSILSRFFRRKKIPLWECKSCGATCNNIRELECGDADATFKVPTVDDEGNQYVEIVKRSACPLDLTTEKKQ